MSNVAFTYQAVVRRWGKQWELLQDYCMTNALQYPDSEEEGEYGEPFKAAKELINERWPEKDDDSETEHFMVTLAGFFEFSQYDTGCGIEHDMQVNVQWSDVSHAGVGDMECINEWYPDPDSEPAGAEDVAFVMLEGSKNDGS